MESGNLRGQIPEPYATNNAALAITLHICGVKFTSVEGVMMPGYNLYSLDFIRSQQDTSTGRKRYKGWQADKAVADLFARGIPGNIVYQFERDSRFAEIIEGFDEGNPDDGKSGATVNVPSLKIIAKICRQFAKTQKQFFGAKNITPLWRERDAAGNLYIPVVRAKEGKGRVERDDSKSSYIGSLDLQQVKV